MPGAFPARIVALAPDLVLGFSDLQADIAAPPARLFRGMGRAADLGDPLGRDRIIADPLEVVSRAPDLIFGSWCGKKFRPERVAARPGWSQVPAVREGEIHEIKSAVILQPGPAALTDGLADMHALIRRWTERRR